MTIEHKNLAGGRWNTFTLCEQLGNIGSEVERALNWKMKGNVDYSGRAYRRALELCDFTLTDPKHLAYIKALARIRERWSIISQEPTNADQPMRCYASTSSPLPARPGVIAERSRVPTPRLLIHRQADRFP